MRTPHSSTPVLRARLIGGYRFVLFLAFAGIAVVTATAVVVQEEKQYATELSTLGNGFIEKSQTLTDIWQQYEEAIDTLRLKAEVYLARNGDPANAKLEAWLFRHGPGRPFDLEQLPPPYEHDHVGNLTGQPHAFDRDFLREIEMALYLNDRYGGLAYSFPEMAWLYYTSKRHFLNLYPWVSTKTYAFAPEPPNKGSLVDRWQAVAEGVGPDSAYETSRRWLGVHMDDAGKGPVMTVAQPVFDAGKAVGVLAMDVTLIDLRARLWDWQTEPGEFFAVTEDGKVIARSVGGLPGDGIEPAASVLPPKLLDGLALNRDSGTVLIHHGYAVQTARISQTPLFLVQVVPVSAIYGKIAAGDLMLVVAGLGGLLLMLFSATYVTDRQLIRPSLKLLDFIRRESRGEGHGVPDVPATWHPWFETIRQAFASHSQMVGLQQELEVARSIQQSILPTRGLSRPEVDIGWRMRAAKVVGGDFYDFFQLDGNRLGVAIADVSGKGVPGALFMAITRTLLRSEARQTIRPGQCLERVNAQLAEDNESVTFVTLFYGILDLRTGDFVYANAGHLPPILTNANGETVELPLTGGIPLGMIAGARYAEERVRLPPGSSILLYTDGITEAFDAGGAQYGEDRLLRQFAEPVPDIDHTLDRLFLSVAEHIGGAAPSDDWTCLLLKFAGPQGGQRSRPGTLSVAYQDRARAVPTGGREREATGSAYHDDAAAD